MPRWSTRKGGRADRALSPRPPRQPLPPSRRRKRCPARDPAGRRQRERTPAPAAADRRAARPGAAPEPALGRPRLRLAASARPARRARHRGRDQQTPLTLRTSPRRRSPRLARPHTTRENTRPARPPPLARRTHQRLATQLATHLNPLGTPPRALPRPPPTRLLDDPLPTPRIVVRQVPGTGVYGAIAVRSIRIASRQLPCVRAMRSRVPAARSPQ